MFSIADIKMNVYPKPGQTKAAEVEMCDCPFTYYGTSCEVIKNASTLFYKKACQIKAISVLERVHV